MLRGTSENVLVFNFDNKYFNSKFNQNVCYNILVLNTNNAVPILHITYTLRGRMRVYRNFNIAICARKLI